MARVVVSGVRIASMLENRHRTVDDLVEAGVSGADVLRLDDSDLELEFDELLTLAKFFKRTWAYLLDDRPERFSKPDHDNRTFENRESGYSIELLDEYEFAVQMLAAANELFPTPGMELPRDIPLTPGNIEESALRIRTLLGVSDEAQLATKDDFAALRMWVAAIHDRGVYVVQRRLNDPTVRAFSMTAGHQALIAVDTADNPLARVYSLLHELGHLLMRSTGTCDLNEHLQIELACNRLAAEVLMPRSVLQAAFAYGGWTGDDADDHRLASLSRQIGASQASLLIRLQQLGWLSDREFQELEARRAVRRPAERKPGGDFYRTAINRVGRRYANKVFEAFEDGRIDRTDAGSLLGVGKHLVGRYERELRIAMATS